MSQDTGIDARRAGSRDVVEDVLALLRENGGRITSAKRLLLHALLENQDHLSADDLAAGVQVRAPDIHRSTIYRNLDELERLNVIDRTRLSHGPATYLASAAHGHLACENCGSPTEIPNDVFH